MKKQLLLLVMMLLPLVASADAVLIDGIYYFLYNEAKTAEVSRNPNYGQTDYCQGDVTIPETVVFDGQTYSVTGIGDYAFEQCNSIFSITIGSKVKTIGAGAFSNCQNLQSITIPTNVETIGEKAFEGMPAGVRCEVAWTTPIAIPANTFSNFETLAEGQLKGILFVPKGTRDAYLNATGWDFFST